jgi:pilus assembly protein Flp/PilA
LQYAGSAFHAIAADPSAYCAQKVYRSGAPEETAVEEVMLSVIEHYLSQIGVNFSDEQGQGLVEYVLIIALIGILLVGGLTAVQGGLDGQFANVAAEVGP